jgi:hypothetical protein
MEPESRKRRADSLSIFGWRIVVFQNVRQVC